MKEPDKIFIIGMPGSGKSTIGQLLAEKLGMPFLDLDVIIEIMKGKSITKIFTQDGEDEFRKIEAQAFNSLVVTNEPFVMATGGGTPCFNDHMEKMNTHGKSIFLNTPLEILASRTIQNNERPLLTDDHQTRLEKLFEERISYYQQAEVIINTAGKSAATLSNEIAQLLG